MSVLKARAVFARSWRLFHEGVGKTPEGGCNRMLTPCAGPEANMRWRTCPPREQWWPFNIARDETYGQEFVRKFTSAPLSLRNKEAIAAQIDTAKRERPNLSHSEARDMLRSFVEGLRA